jgi:sugar lactone lactonase YvrE
MNDGTMGTILNGNGLNAPKGIAIDAAGNVWVANSGAGGGVSVFTSSGGVVGNYSSGLTAPTSIAVNPQ